MRVLAGAAVHVTAPDFVDLDQAPTLADAPPTVTATSVATGAPVATGDVDQTDGGYRVPLGPVEDLGPVDLTWTGTVAGHPQTRTAQVEVVGGHLATVADVLAHPDMRQKQSTADDRIRALLDEFADLVAAARGASYGVPRWARDHLTGADTVLSWPLVREILAVTVDGTPVDPATLDPGDTDGITWPGGVRRPGVIVVDYHHGTSTVPPGLRRAATGFVAASITAEDSGVARDALWETTDSGTIRYSTPDWDRGRFTGLIAVDAALHALTDHRDPGIG